ncbi:hypothetical protein SBFV2_gp09 [Sulfolobales Beppu filamentous virus 2]|uniref:Uncharacterized protein n=1 Tax=Sulfolobales Beppu filamentous virus 2 TaxID=2493123 RepID=A0A3Q8Q3Q1_9VIRU|nr:hypothetical protein HOU84_gp09 [Sulfolobales Beppu filamentous virus 2]AZI75776.1 hypothetical protein SBFV2_gp09 [Sulfolobales Beppu filamentous virus 2]
MVLILFLNNSFCGKLQFFYKPSGGKYLIKEVDIRW